MKTFRQPRPWWPFAALVLFALQAAGQQANQEPSVAAARIEAELEQLRQRLREQQQNLEAQRKLVESLGAPEAASEPPVRLYGFADAGLQKLVVSPRAFVRAILPTTATTFVLGNVNLYVDVQPIEHWSGLFEVRLTNLPDGVDAAGSPGTGYFRNSTSIYDQTSASGGFNQIKLGGLILERAYLQYQHDDAFSIRVGSFLTPFGIWNIDHGLPTQISLMLPQFEINELFPTKLLGVEVLGSINRAHWEFGYFGYVSNGRTPGQLSFSEDKMLGGRLFARTTRPFRMTFGLSGFAGRFSDQIRATDTLFAPVYTTREVVAYHEQALGADASLDLGNLRLRSELAFRRVRYDAGKRDSFFGHGTFTPDHNEWDWYVLSAYQLPWLGLEPFLYGEVYRYPTPLGEGAITLSAGFNIHFNPAVQLKSQYAHTALYEKLGTLVEGTSDAQDFHVFSTRLVLAF